MMEVDALDSLFENLENAIVKIWRKDPHLCFELIEMDEYWSTDSVCDHSDPRSDGTEDWKKTYDSYLCSTHGNSERKDQRWSKIRFLC